MSKEFKTGDVVKLKSGGPDMTIIDIVYNRDESEILSIHCIWFDNHRKVRDHFKSWVLKHVNEDKEESS